MNNITIFSWYVQKKVYICPVIKKGSITPFILIDNKQETNV